MQTLNFLFNNTELKIYGTVQDPYFKVKDICELIQIRETSRMIRDIQDENPTGNLPSGLQIKGKNGKQIPFVDEFGLYEILFRTNSKLSSDFKLEIKKWLKQQRLQQNILLQEKIYQLEQYQEELNQKIIDQQIQHEQELENRERIHFVITMNVKKRKNTSSQFKGVTFNQNAGKWKVQIRINGKKTYLGMFTNEEEAAIAYDLQAIQHFGEFARLNFPRQNCNQQNNQQ